MALIVQKYGGTSVGSPERIQNVARRVAKYRQQGHQVVVVVSAMSGETNRLVALTQALSDAPDPREVDVVLATGEQVTIGLTAIALQSLGIPARSYTGWQVPIHTDSAFTKARILEIEPERMLEPLARLFTIAAKEIGPARRDPRGKRLRMEESRGSGHRPANQPRP